MNCEVVEFGCVKAVTIGLSSVNKNVPMMRDVYNGEADACVSGTSI